MKAARKRKFSLEALAVLTACVLAAGPAWALSYGETYDVLEFVDQQNKANAVGAAISVGAAFAGPALNSVTSNITSSPILQGAIQGAVIGGASDLATGGDGTGALYGAGAGAISGYVTGESPGGFSEKGKLSTGSYMGKLGASTLASEAGKGATQLAIRELDADPATAQFIGMTVGGVVRGALSDSVAKNQGAKIELDDPRMLKHMGLSAAQAGVYVGVESAFKDKEWAPYVASYAGETLGTLGFAAIAGSMHEDGMEAYIDGDDYRNMVADGLGTAVTASLIDADKPEARAQMLGSVTSRATLGFLEDADKGDEGKGLENLVAPAATAGAYYGMQKLHKASHVSPMALDYTVAATANAIEYSLADGEKQPGVAKAMRNTQFNVVDFSYDPQKYNGSASGNGKTGDFSAYGNTQRNSQLYNFTGLSGLQHQAHQIREQGGDWKDQTNRTMSKSVFESFSSRAANVYNSAATTNVRNMATTGLGLEPTGVQQQQGQSGGSPDTGVSYNVPSADVSYHESSFKNEN
ncbi:hypothetical protein ACFL2I_03365 [Candidatus Omnitrophota bacterium]